MARKKSRKQRRSRRSSSKRSRGSAASSPFESIARAVEQNQHERALKLLNHHAPVGEPKRLLWLVEHWESQAERELREIAPDRVEALLTETLGAFVLSAPHKVWSVIQGLDLPVVHEAKRVRAASEAIAQGDDEEALEALKGISVRSPFRDHRLFLRGLSAFYNHRDDEARRCFERLAGGDGPLARASRLFLSRVAPEAQEPDADTVEALAAHPIGQAAQLQQLQRLVAANQLNTALRKASKLAKGGDAVLKTGLFRDLATLLIRQAQAPVDDVIRRVTRAVGDDPGDPSGDRLKALCYEINCPCEECSLTAIDAWGRYGHRLRDKADKAAVKGRIGELYMKMARSEEEASVSPFALFGRGRRRVSECWEFAIEELREAVALRPQDLELWTKLLEALKQDGDDLEHGRTLEEMVKLFPESPQVWLQAARAASERSSYHKARRYIQRAIDLEPMGRDLRDQELMILLGMARKYVRQGRLDRARESYQEACQVPYCHDAMRLKARAEVMVLEDLYGDEQEALAWRQRALEDAPRPWEWSCRVVIGREHLTPSRRGRPNTKAPTPSRRRFDLLGALAQAPDPSAPEVTEVLKLALSYEHHFELTPAPYQNMPLNTGTEMFPIVKAALERGGHLLEEKPALGVALAVPIDPSRALAIAEAATRRFPDEGSFLEDRCLIAMELGKPASYFDDLLPILDRLIEEGDDEVPLPDGIPPQLAGMFSAMMGGPQEHPLEGLKRDLKAYLRKARGSKRSQKRSRTKKPGSKR